MNVRIVLMFALAGVLSGSPAFSQGSGVIPPVPAGVRPLISDPVEVQRCGKQSNEDWLSARKAVKDGHMCEALREYSSALLARERIWGDRDPGVVVLLQEQADLFRKQRQWHDCEQNYRKLLAIQIHKTGPGSIELDKFVATLGDLCEREGDNTDALTYYQELVALRTKFQPADSMPLKTARLHLACQLTIAQDYPSAEEILKSAIADEDAKSNPDNAYLSKVLDAYRGLLREAMRPEEAAQIEERERQVMRTLQNPTPAVRQTSATNTAVISAKPATQPIAPAPEAEHK